MSIPPRYKIIYNWDGAPHGYSPVPQSVDDFLAKAYAPLQDTQVGALFWSAGGRGSRWPSEVVEYIGQERDRPYAAPEPTTAPRISCRCTTAVRIRKKR